MLDRHITGKLEVGRAGKWRAAWIFPAAEDLLVRSARLGRLGGPPATSVPTRRAPYLTLASSASRNSIQIYLNSSSCKPIMSENNAVTFNWFRKFINGPMKFDKLSGSFRETVSKFCGIGHYFRYLPTKKRGKIPKKIARCPSRKWARHWSGGPRQLDTGKIGKLKNLAANDLLGFV